MARHYYVADVCLECRESPIAVGDDKFRIRMPYDGEILGGRGAPRIAGWIKAAGTGASTYTEVQIRNVTQGRDYLTTKARFNVDDQDANGHAVLANGAVLSTQPTFRRDDVLALDVDAVPSGNDSAQAVLHITCGFWVEV